MELIQRDEASSRLRDVVDIPDGLSAQLIRDHQIRLLTKEKRDALTARSVIFGSSSKALLSDADNVLICPSTCAVERGVALRGE